MTDAERFAQTLQGGADITGNSQLMQQTMMTAGTLAPRRAR